MPEPADLIIETSPSRISRILGEDIGADSLKEVLESLGFTVETASGTLSRQSPCPDMEINKRH